MINGRVKGKGEEEINIIEEREEEIEIKGLSFAFEKL